MRNLIFQAGCIDVSQSRKNDVLAIWTLDWRLQKPGHYWTSIFRRMSCLLAGPICKINLNSKWNGCGLMRSDVNPMNLAAVVQQDGLAVRGEGIVWDKVAGGACFLVVSLDGVDEPMVFIAIEIADAQAGLAMIASGIDEQLAVGRKAGTEGAAGRGYGCYFLACLQIAAHYMPERKGNIIIEAEPGLGFVVEIVAVGRQRCAKRVAAKFLWSVRGCF